MRIVAVILNWRRADLTIACLRSLRGTAPDVLPFVVDNASGDGSVERIRDAFPDQLILETEENLGYSGGNNAGFRAIIGELPEAVLVLNNDLELEAGCVQALVAALEADPDRAIVAPVHVRADDPTIIDFARGTIDVHDMEVHAPGRDEPGDPSQDVESDYAPGSAFLIRSAVLEELGGFDERFFLVWEDVDLALRARGAGYGRPLMVARARVRHHGSSSFGGAETPLYRYFFVRNSYLVAARHLRGWSRWRAMRRLDKRYRGWAESATDERIANAIRLGQRDALIARFGPAPEDLETD